VARTERVLFVCTANQGRSPMAEALLRARLARQGADGVVEVGSAGLWEGGFPVSEPVQAVVAGRGGDLRAHRSRRVTAEMAGNADLVVGLAAEHVHEVVALDPALADRTFTLKALARHLEASPPRRPGQALRDYVADAGVLDAGPDDDVEDPYGRPVSAVAETAEEITGLLDRVVPRLWPAGEDAPGHR
jgi:protein-tyrosine phosphatase